GLSHGFHLGYKGNRFPRAAKNLPSAIQQPQVIEKNLLEEVQLGRLAGPFESTPFQNFQIHPLGLVPKKGSQKWRTIFHLSYPKGSPDSLNANIPIEDYTLQYIRIDDAIALVLNHGPGSALFSFNQLADTLEWLVRQHLNIPPSYTFSTIFRCSTCPSSLCATALCRVLTLFEELNIPLAPQKTFRPTQVLEFMGITLDSVNMQARLPEDKLSNARSLL
ncbi:unnamed protein product, partial [Porites lobata]